MKKFYFLILFFGALLFCACEKESIDPLIGDQAQTQLEDGVLKGAKKHAVPFKASFETYEILDEEPPPQDPDAAFQFWAHGIGNASHLGKTILLQDQRWGGSFPINDGWGDMILTAANGDELWSEYENYHGWDDLPFFYITGEGEFTGGTGRFENATGNFTMVETWNLLDGVGTSVYKGEIQY